MREYGTKMSLRERERERGRGRKRGREKESDQHNDDVQYIVSHLVFTFSFVPKLKESLAKLAF